MTSVNIHKLQETLESFKNFEIDEEFQSTPFDSASFIPRYEHVRDEYLKRRVLHAFLTEVEKEQPSIEAPSEEELADLENRQRKVFSSLVGQIQKIQNAKTELQSKYSLFTTKRQNLEQILKEIGNSSSIIEDDTVDDCSDVDEEDIALQEERLLNLQQQASSLKAEISKVQNEAKELETAIKELDVKGDHNDPSSLERLREENEKLAFEVQRLEEVEQFYEKLIAVIEELSGIRVLGVDAVCSSDTEEDLLFTIEVSERHRIQIGLNSNKKTPEDLRVVFMKLLSSAFLESDCLDRSQVVRLAIPDFSDLVELSENFPRGDNLRFVIREAVARIQILEARLNALVDLKTERGVVVNIGRTERTSGVSCGGQNQEVVCSLDREQITVVLSLTPDCPLSKNSVYISQIVGLGGWNEEEMLDLQETVTSLGPFSRPLEVIQELRFEIQRRVENEGWTIPLTPRLPVVGQGFGK